MSLSPIEDTTIRLASGRAVAFTTWGDPRPGVGGSHPHRGHWIRRLPGARVTRWANVGHLGVVKHWDEVLAAIHPERCSTRTR